MGHTFSPISGEEVKKDSVSDVIDFIKSAKKDSSFILLAPLDYKVEDFSEQLKTLKVSGFTRLEIGGNVASIEDLVAFSNSVNEGK